MGPNTLSRLVDWCSDEIGIVTAECEQWRTLAIRASNALPCVCMVAGDSNCVRCEIEKAIDNV
jgi:hypothetical protein